MNGPTKAVGPPWTPLPARKSKGVLEKVLDDADAVIDGDWPRLKSDCARRPFYKRGCQEKHFPSNWKRSRHPAPCCDETL